MANVSLGQINSNPLAGMLRIGSSLLQVGLLHILIVKLAL